jgi:hypothetical protein
LAAILSGSANTQIAEKMPEDVKNRLERWINQQIRQLSHMKQMASLAAVAAVAASRASVSNNSGSLSWHQPTPPPPPSIANVVGVDHRVDSAKVSLMNESLREINLISDIRNLPHNPIYNS